MIAGLLHLNVHLSALLCPATLPYIFFTACYSFNLYTYHLSEVLFSKVLQKFRCCSCVFWYCWYFTSWCDVIISFMLFDPHSTSINFSVNYMFVLGLALLYNVTCSYTFLVVFLAAFWLWFLCVIGQVA